MSRPHALFPPSSAYRWIRCPASIPLEQQIRDDPERFGVKLDDESPAADEGTFAHEVAERCLLHNRTVQEEMGGLATHEFLLLDQYLDWIRRQPGVLYVEQRLPIIDPHCWGTADAVKLGKTLLVADLKFGRVPVAARNNAQLLAYAYGALRRFDPNGEMDRITLAIFQPRRSTGGDPWDVWETDRETVLHAAKRMRQAIGAVLSARRPQVMAGDHCRYCPARGVNCPIH